ncbi:double-strand break repair protein AddB [Emcibacter sp. SYSU 3D8]|uniref:double-strand break repair protein AddB n=1 Tax=Emcibacter sp. SYSU 3D8 TaxID=3133969 RepID=UPI0031FEE8DE
MTSPSVFTIPAGISFVDALARGLMVRYGADPLALGRVRVLLPTRRAARTLREAFLRLSDGKALILPVMQPLGDVDEGELSFATDGADALDVPPAIPALERTLLLARLVQAWRLTDGDGGDEPSQAFRLAAELGSFLDQVQTEGCDLADMHALVPDDFAHHWQKTIRFLEILATSWPTILETRGYLDPAARRDRLLRLLAARWTAAPPATPVIAAGSTGSIPASADLIGVIARLPQGAVVLPGFQRDMDVESWEALAPSHPQFGMKQLLARMAVDRAEVEPWTGEAQAPPPRAALLNEAMRPAETTAAWQNLAVDRAAALAGLFRIDAPTPQEEAGAIAVILREALEHPGRTAALVTPDRDLGRRVAAALRRWDIAIDDSAGTPLPQTQAAAFLRLTADMAASAAAPVPLLAALKHPLAAGGLDPGRFRRHVRDMERAVLRGPRPAPGIKGLGRALATADPPVRPGLIAWWDDVAAKIGPFMALFSQGEIALPELIRAHVQLVESLAATASETGAARLWVEEAGEAAAAFLEEFIHTAEGTPIEARHYPALLDAAMQDGVVRPAYGRHPRLAILGPLEARLHHADVMILGGLNEGTWPPQASADPWMSRPMKQRFGLPPPERRIGLSAHDFVQGAAAPLVYLTRAEKVGGAPTLPSRWLLRLDALVGQDNWPRPPHLAWHRRLDHVERPAPLAPPAPTPPLSARPRRLSVTRIENWLRDPYALYARNILRLQVMDPLDADAGAADRGNFIHQALHHYLEAHPGAPPPDGLERLLDFGREAFGTVIEKPLVRAFWWPRFTQIAAWFLDRQRERLGIAAPVALERSGALVLGGLPGGDFTLTAKADRIDRLSHGRLEIIDYKTGREPSRDQLLAGYGAQMPLEAVMAKAGAFADLAAAEVAELAWWKLKGDARFNEIKLASAILKDEPGLEELAADAEAGLRRLVAAFDDPAVPYVSRPNPLEVGFGEYDHLARVKEWGE